MAKHIEPTVTIGRNKDIISISIDVVFQAEAARMFTIFADRERWPSELPARVLKMQPHTKLITALEDYSRPVFTFKPHMSGCEVNLFHELIPSLSAKETYEKVWNDWFDQLQVQVAP